MYIPSLLNVDNHAGIAFSYCYSYNKNVNDFFATWLAKANLK